MTVVIVEKQSVAKRIAKALGAGKKVPYVSHSDIHYWETILNGDNTSRTLAGVLGVFYKLVEDSIGVTRCRQAVGMGVEVIAQSREDAFGYF